MNHRYTLYILIEIKRPLVDYAKRFLQVLNNTFKAKFCQNLIYQVNFWELENKE